MMINQQRESWKVKAMNTEIPMIATRKNNVLYQLEYQTDIGNGWAK
jgi:hypothetical protein